ncbi:MAG: hypothetical protein J5680_04940 [Neisseriaceae bacterium]|nr:hypothetical protein [Neisseriaceae bacterium]
MGNLLPTRFCKFSGSLKPFTHKPFGLFGGLKTHPTTKPAVLRWAGMPTLYKIRVGNKLPTLRRFCIFQAA